LGKGGSEVARNRLNKVYSIYHAMEDRGVFEQNKANAQAVNNDGLSTYSGPVEYPKMLYHPKGEEYCVSQGIMIVDRDNRPVYDEKGNPKYAGSVFAIKNRVVDTLEEEETLKAEGWHYTEGDALRANPDKADRAPPKSKVQQQADRIKELEMQLALIGQNEAKSPNVK
jgi:hypothetical protein